MIAGEFERDARRRREADFHDGWAREEAAAELLVDETFTAATAVENQYILAQFGDLKGRRVLDYGCGAAEGGVFMAKHGADVVCVDVAPEMLALAKRVAAHHGVRIETRQVTGDAIPAETGEFDLIYGNGVLHHVPLEVVRSELARVMRVSGKGCFIEPLGYNPLIEVYRRMARAVRTADETALSFADIRSFSETFGAVEHQEFWFTTLTVFLKFFLIDRVHPSEGRYWKRIYSEAERVGPLFTRLKRLDDRLLGLLPVLRRLCWTTVITVSQPRPAS